MQSSSDNDSVRKTNQSVNLRDEIMRWNAIQLPAMLLWCVRRGKFCSLSKKAHLLIPCCSRLLRSPWDPLCFSAFFPWLLVWSIMTTFWSPRRVCWLVIYGIFLWGIQRFRLIWLMYNMDPNSFVFLSVVKYSPELTTACCLKKCAVSKGCKGKHSFLIYDVHKL